MSHSNFTTEHMFHAFGSTLLCYLQSMIINALIFKKHEGMAFFRREKPSFPKISKNLLAISAILVSTCKLRFLMFPLAISKQLAQPLALRQLKSRSLIQTPSANRTWVALEQRGPEHQFLHSIKVRPLYNKNFRSLPLPMQPQLAAQERKNLSSLCIKSLSASGCRRRQLDHWKSAVEVGNSRFWRWRNSQNPTRPTSFHPLSKFVASTITTHPAWYLCPSHSSALAVLGILDHCKHLLLQRPPWHRESSLAPICLRRWDLIGSHKISSIAG